MLETMLFENPMGCNWCSIVDAFQTSAIEQCNNARLDNRVKIFGLSDNLLI